MDIALVLVHNIIYTSNLKMVMMTMTKVGGLTPLASSPSGDGGFLSLDGGFLGPRPALVHDHIRCDQARSLLLINFPSIRKKAFKTTLGPRMLCTPPLFLTMIDHPCTYLSLTCTSSLHI